jgi:hypothetical protein
LTEEYRYQKGFLGELKSNEKNKSLGRVCPVAVKLLDRFFGTFEIKMLLSRRERTLVALAMADLDSVITWNTTAQRGRRGRLCMTSTKPSEVLARVPRVSTRQKSLIFCSLMLCGTTVWYGALIRALVPHQLQDNLDNLDNFVREFQEFYAKFVLLTPKAVRGIGPIQYDLKLQADAQASTEALRSLNRVIELGKFRRDRLVKFDASLLCLPGPHLVVERPFGQEYNSEF